MDCDIWSSDFPEGIVVIHAFPSNNNAACGQAIFMIAVYLGLVYVLDPSRNTSTQSESMAITATSRA